ncbi:PEP-CTERM sorting domain-containing protein [Congregibacter brevis]|uniref:PEP-CTERM sorting domain-containing protein n=1 Tax=Congregibacter brevis TaxID=3081201 RepID=A0ABZ0IFI7_9GAMM|nr:PEP-CTERM sorting domain-containing protein [Congregibacter sp. IMCC45268]
MKNFKSNALIAGSALALAVATAPSQALQITFGGQDANVPGGDGSGLTSQFAPLNNMSSSPYLFIETFDVATYTPLPALSDPTNVGIAGVGTAGTTGDVNGDVLGGIGNIIQPEDAQAPVCSINAFGGPIISATGNGFGVQQGTTTSAATPANNDTCFAYGPRAGETPPSSLRVDYAPLIAATGFGINYLGLYYGSIDTYNNIAFYSGDELLQGTGLLSDGVLSGSEILDVAGGISGNRILPGSNVYVNLFFNPGEAFTAFEFTTTGIAFELDNIVVRVPAPATLGLFGLGLLALGAASRKRSAS